MNDIQLSICIATRNRGAFIGETLESIICQATDHVEIVVLDGASTDNTEQVVGHYQRSFPRLRYIRQNANMGVDQDFAEAVSLSSGAYCWLFSDDDLLKTNAIPVVLDAVQNQYGLIIANAEVCNVDLSKILDPRRLSLKANRIYKRGVIEPLLADVGDYLTFIGSVIIKRELWNAREKESYFGSCFVHVGVIFQSPLPEDTLVIAEPLISIRYGNASWFAKYFEIWMFRWPALIWSFACCPESAKLRVCAKEPWRRFRNLLLHRAKASYTKKGYAEWLEPRLESYPARLVSKAIAHIPGRIANFLGVAYYSVAFFLFHRPGYLLVLVDLRNSPFYFWKSRKRRWAKESHAAIG